MAGLLFLPVLSATFAKSFGGVLPPFPLLRKGNFPSKLSGNCQPGFPMPPSGGAFFYSIFKKAGLPSRWQLLTQQTGIVPASTLFRPNATKPLSFCCVGDNRKKWSAANAANFPSRCGTLSGTGNKIMVLFRLVCFLLSGVLANPSYTMRPGLSTGFSKLCADRVRPGGGGSCSRAAYQPGHKSK